MCQGLAPWCLQYVEVPQKTLLYVSIHPFLCIIQSVVVTVNKMKPFAHAPVPVNTWEPLPGAVASGFFYVRTRATAHVSGSTRQAWGTSDYCGKA